MSTIGRSASKGAAEAVNKIVGHWAFWVVMALIVLYVGYTSKEALKTWWAKQKGTDRGNYQQLDGTPRIGVDTPFGYNPNYGNPRVAELQAFAVDMYRAMDGVPAWNDTRPELMIVLTNMNDTEIKFVADHYEQISGGNSILDDVTGEWTVVPGAARTDLIAKLRSLNL